jgi:hypothetical protein
MEVVMAFSGGASFQSKTELDAGELGKMICAETRLKACSASRKALARQLWPDHTC